MTVLFNQSLNAVVKPVLLLLLSLLKLADVKNSNYLKNLCRTVFYIMLSDLMGDSSIKTPKNC